MNFNINDIAYFILTLSIVFVGKHLIEFLVLLFGSTPKEIKIPKINIVLLYVSIAYILTFVGKLIFN